MQPNYKRTKLACYAAIITQAVQNNLPPLLFVLFRNSSASPMRCWGG